MTRLEVGPAVHAAPMLAHSPTVRVLCYCGTLFSLEGDVGVCPGCRERAVWPSLSAVEREMRLDLDELLREHGGDSE